MYVSWVLGDKLRIVMSSIMRWRRGEIGLVIGGLLSVGLHERAILADRTPPTMIQLRLGRPTAKRNLRTKVSKPQKPTILDWSHQPHHRRLPRQRFSATGRSAKSGPSAEPTRVVEQTARALGIDVPMAFSAAADEIIE
jgi:hypothetical protein